MQKYGEKTSHFGKIMIFDHFWTQITQLLEGIQSSAWCQNDRAVVENNQKKFTRAKIFDFALLLS